MICLFLYYLFVDMSFVASVLGRTSRLAFVTASRTLTTKVPAVPEKQKDPEDFINPAPKLPHEISVRVDDSLNVGDLTGIPEEHIQRRVRIFKQAREATQSGWNNTKVWKIEVDQRERWENNLIGWASNGDPLSNISMALKFASAEDAARFCDKNGWEYEIEQPRERKIVPKSYGVNFSWNKKTRLGSK